MTVSVIKNIFYSFTYQVLAFIIPLVTSPYIARILGPSQIGVYSYTYSIAYYFMMLVMLGIMNYGTRYIAKVRANQVELENGFWSIYSIQLLMFLFSITLYYIYCLVRNSPFLRVELCQSLFILAYGLDITWFFSGKELFKLIAVRNAIVKILNAILIFAIIREENDVWKYTLIMSACTVLGQLIQWPFLFTEIGFMKVKIHDITKHLKGVLILFLPVLAISIFVYMDKVMIGYFSNMAEAGFYENADKVLSIPKSFIQAVGAVMLPHTTSMIAIGQVDKLLRSIKTTMYSMIWIACGSLFGLAAIAPIFSVVFWGDNFAGCSDVMSIISISLLFSCFGNVIRTQYLITNERDKDYTLSLVVGAIVNIVVNYLLIGTYGAVGAAVGTVAAEFSLCFYQVWCVKKELEVGVYVRNGLPFFAIGLGMFAVVRYMLKTLYYDVWNLVGLIVCGFIIYVVCSLLYMKFSNDKNDNDMYCLLLGKITSKKRR